MKTESSNTHLITSLNGPIVIFGAGGFVGANLAKVILNYREDVFAITHQDFIPWRLVDFPADQIIKCDISDQQQVAKLFERHQFKTIFCLSAYGAYSHQSDTHLIYETNIIGLINLMETAKENGVSALVHAGSSSEYGLNCSAPKEDSSLIPNSHYSLSKITCSYIISYYARFFDMPTVNLRLYSIYGRLEDPDRLIPKLILKGMEGSFPPLVSREVSRDFVYIDDCIEAFILAAHNISSIKGKSINIASEQRTTIEDVVMICRSIFNIKKEPIWGDMPNRQWDLTDWYGQAILAKKLMNWHAKTTLEDGLFATKEWFTRNYNDFYGVRILKTIGQPLRISLCLILDKNFRPLNLDLNSFLKKMSSQLKMDYELILIVDGPSKLTESFSQEISSENPRIKVIKHTRCFGKTASIFSAIEVSSGNAFISVSYEFIQSPETFIQAVNEWLVGYDIVEVVYDPKSVSVIEKFLLHTYNFMSETPLIQGYTENFILDRYVYKQFLSMKETDPFLPGLRSWFGFKTKIIELPIYFRRPKKTFFENITIWKHALFDHSRAPIEIFFYLGLSITLLSIIGAFIQIFAKILDPSIPHGVTTIILVTLFFGGLNMLGISILSDFLGRVFMQVKDRPRYQRVTTDDRKVDKAQGVFSPKKQDLNI